LHVEQIIIRHLALFKMSLFQKIWNIGILKKTPEVLHSRIQLSNQIIFVLSSMSVLFIVVLLIIGTTELIHYAIIAIVLCLIVIGLSALGQNGISRIILGVLPVIFMTYLHIVKVPLGQVPIAGNYVLTFSLMVIPFIIFDISERWKITSTVIFNSFLFIFLPIMLGWVEKESIIYAEQIAIERQSVYYLGGLGVFLGSFYILTSATHKEKENALNAIKALQQSKTESDKTRLQLEETLKEVEKAKKGDEERNWISEGLTKFAEMMRVDENYEGFLDKFLSELSKHIEANQAALFMLEGENKSEVLQMKAAYAFGRKKFLEHKFQVGEGLVGQAFLEKDKFFLTEIPPNYKPIESASGNALPRCILIVPLVLNEEALGVLELSSFKVFQPFEVEFLERLSDNLAVMLHTKKVSEQTQRLLEVSQMQANDLKSQEEEMRQNMEELMATQEEMRRKEQQLVNRIAELESTKTKKIDLVKK